MASQPFSWKKLGLFSGVVLWLANALSNEARAVTNTAQKKTIKGFEVDLRMSRPNYLNVPEICFGGQISHLLQAAFQKSIAVLPIFVNSSPTSAKTSDLNRSAAPSPTSNRSDFITRVILK